MANSFNKKELEKRKEQKKKEKLQRKEVRKASGSKSFDDMIAYVDENGVITSTPPDPDKKTKVDLDDIVVSTPKREEMEEIALNGRVEHFNFDKGYGFIKNLSGTDKYFFHVSNAPVNIAEGNMVTFELERSEKGMNAVKIVLTK
jgi:cold shock CspA family protein